MSKFWSVALLVVGLAGLADVLTHPAGTAAATKGFTGIETPALNAVLGK